VWVYDERGRDHRAEGEGDRGTTVDESLAKLSKPRGLVMVPAAFTGDTVMELARKMEPGDIIIDGGNSYYCDDIDRAKALAEMQIHYVDCGTSGGVLARARVRLMIGGEDDVVGTDPIFKTIASGGHCASTPRLTVSRRRPRTATSTAVRTAPATS
jgi:6-phosphogluconate dehydrogenase